VFALVLLLLFCWDVVYAAHASSYHHPIITYHKPSEAKTRDGKVRQGKARLPSDGAGGDAVTVVAPPWLTDCGT